MRECERKPFHSNKDKEILGKKQRERIKQREKERKRERKGDVEGLHDGVLFEAGDAEAVHDRSDAQRRAPPLVVVPFVSQPIQENLHISGEREREKDQKTGREREREDEEA